MLFASESGDSAEKPKYFMVPNISKCVVYFKTLEAELKTTTTFTRRME